MHRRFLFREFCKVSERPASRVCIAIKRVLNNTALRKRLAGYVQKWNCWSFVFSAFFEVLSYDSQALHKWYGVGSFCLSVNLLRAKQLWQVTKQVHRVIRKLFPWCKGKFSLHLFLTLPNAVMWFDKSVNRDQLSNIERSVNFVTSQENDRQFCDICLKTVYAK